MWNDPLAPAMHKYARDAKAALAAEGAGGPDEWIEFLFWDDNAPEADYTTLNTSYASDRHRRGGGALRLDSTAPPGCPSAPARTSTIPARDTRPSTPARSRWCAARARWW